MKKILAICIIMICIGILSFEYLLEFFPSQFETIIIGNGDVLECPEDISKGFYNIKVIEGKVGIGLVNLKQDEVYHNYHVQKNSKIFIDKGIGKIKISQSERSYYNGNNFEISEIGNYEIGGDIEEGMYKVTLITKQRKNEKITCFLNNDEGNGINQYIFENQNKSETIVLQKKQILFIGRTTDINEDKTGFLLHFEKIKQ